MLRGFVRNLLGQSNFVVIPPNPYPQIRSKYLLSTGIFSPSLYLELNPDVASTGIDPAEHYMQHGHREGREPHPLFDIGWYAEQLAQEERHKNPILHYANEGVNRDISPNVFFNPMWYRRQYRPDENPLVHFLKFGGRETNPSYLFDAVRYYEDYPHVAKSGENPLVHYMMRGMSGGARVHPVACAETEMLAFHNANLSRLVQKPRTNDRLALLITHAPTEKLKGHVEHYIRAFVGNKIDVCLIVASDVGHATISPALSELCSSIYIRENKGFDFAAWAHVMADDPSILESETLYLTNDSMIGPLDAAEFSKILAAIENSSSDFVGLTDNSFYARHIQSYFLAIKRSGLQSSAFREFFASVLNLRHKNEVIRCYEITFSKRMENAGYRTEALFPMSLSQTFAGNRAIHDWRGLADSGMPFIKASLVFGEQKQTAGVATRAYLKSRGFDLSLLPAP